MSGKYFADTNVLVYAFDSSEPDKQLIAQQILEEQGSDGALVLEYAGVAGVFRDGYAQIGETVIH